MFSRSGAPDSPASAIDVPGTGTLKALFRTSMGNLEIELFEEAAPRTVANFVGLALGNVEWTDPAGRKAARPLYSGTIFHRVIPGFMIQGGDPQGSGMGGPGYRWKDEKPALAVKHDQPGMLSMANAGPDTNGSQFFITEVPTPHLDGRHAVFGRVIENLPLVATITGVPRGPNDRPNTPITLDEVKIYRGSLA